MPKDEWWSALFASIDAKDTRAFLAFLTPDALFRYGSAPQAVGAGAIEQAVSYFFTTIEQSRHRLLRRWDDGDSAVCQGEVTYTLADGREVTLPFCNVFELAGDRIRKYEIYIDPTPLAATR